MDLQGIEHMDHQTIQQHIQQLDCYHNITQLQLLLMEIHYLKLLSSPPPTPDWYAIRILLIQTYSQLEWKSLSVRFHRKDDIIYYGSKHILQLIELIHQQWALHQSFQLDTYHELLQHIYHVWMHYDKTYIQGETDEDVIELIEHMTHL